MLNFFFQKYLKKILQLSLNIILSINIYFNKRIFALLNIKENFEFINLHTKTGKRRSEISVFEMFNINENIIVFFVWSIFLKKKYGSRCLCYPTKINNLYNPINSYIYRKLGFEILDYHLNLKQIVKVNTILNQINFKNLSKKNLLNLKIKKIPIGDLIYDHYLRYEQKPTIDLDSKKLFLLIKNALEIFVFWDDFFDENNVKRICFSHSPYLLGLPGRIAAFKRVDSLCLSGNSTFRFNKKNIFLGDQFKKSRDLLNNYLSSKGTREKKYIIKKNKMIMNDIFSGRSNPSYYLPYNQKNIFKKKNKGISKISKNLKILISAHDFYEGPNLWGKFIFADFYEWLIYLSNYISKDKNSNREWYIKPHPDASSEQLDIIKNIFKKNKNIKILKPNTTHIDLINKKINFVLTARGSIGYQYAYFGINSLYCSDIGLYKSFNFMYKSNSLKDYEKKLNDMERMSKRKTKISGVLEFMIILDIFIYNKRDFILPNIDHITRKKKLYLFQARSEKYKIESLKIVKEFLTEKQIIKIFNEIDNFITKKNKLLMITD